MQAVQNEKKAIFNLGLKKLNKSLIIKINSIPFLQKFRNKYAFYFIQWARFLFLIGLAFALYSYAMLQGGFLSWFLFYALLPFFLYAFILFVYPLSDFYIERIIVDSNLTAGQSLNLQIKLRRKQNFPLFFLGVVEELPQKIGLYNDKKVGKSACFPLFNSEFSVYFTIPYLPRGEHHFSTIQLKIRDPLSLIEKRKTFVINETLIVYPNIRRASFHQYQSDYELGRHVNVMRRNRESNVASHIREYQPGDRLSTIDWKSTAKKAELMSKDFEEKNSQDLLVVVNNFANEQIFEAMVSYSASLIDTEIRRNGKAGLYLIGEIPFYLPSRDNKDQRNKCMLALAKVEAEAPESCNQFFTISKGSFTGHCSLVLVTDQLSGDMIKRLSLLSDKNLHSQIVLFKNHSNLTLQDQRLIESAKGNRIGVECINHLAD